MSDFFRDSNNPSQNTGDPSERTADQWQRFASPQGGDADPYAMFRRPADNTDSGLLDAAPQLGAEMQQSGVPLFPEAAQGPEAQQFMLHGDEAPTKVASLMRKPQTVNKRTTVSREPTGFQRPTLPAQQGGSIAHTGMTGRIAPAVTANEAAHMAANPNAIWGTARRAAVVPASEAPARRRRSSRYAEGAPAAEPSAQPQVPQGGYQGADAPAQPQQGGYADYGAPAQQSPAQRGVSTPGDNGADMPAYLRRQPVQHDYDLFQAGDSEAPDEEGTQAPRRAVDPDGRYTGARTAMPQSGAAARRQPSGTSVADKANAAKERVLDRQGDGEQTAYPADMPQARPQPGQRPMQPGQRPAQPGQQRPMQPGQRPMQPGQRPAQPGQRPTQPGQRPVPGQPEAAQRAPQQRQRPIPGQRPPQQEDARYAGAYQPDEIDAQDDEASYRRKQMPARPQEDSPMQKRLRGEADSDRRRLADRPKYDFEDEDDEEDDGRRKHGCLMPIVSVLLVLGILLAVILIPNWDGMNSGIGTAIGSIKSKITGVFSSIFPEEELISSFKCDPSSGTAPLQLTFTVQTAKSVQTVRVQDDNQNVVAEASIDSNGIAGITVTQNSNMIIWALSYTVPDEYTGQYYVTAQAKGSEDWCENIKLDTMVVVQPPVSLTPDVSNFDCTPSSGDVPLTLRFSVRTGSQVLAIRVADDYDNELFTKAWDDSEDTGESDTRVWAHEIEISQSYEGSYHLLYQLDTESAFEDSSFAVRVSLTAPDDTPAPDEGGDATPLTEPDATVAPTDTPAPTAAPTAAPTVAPTALPLLPASFTDDTAPSALKLTATLYEGTKKLDSFSRTKVISMLNPYSYSYWEGGVFAFRGGNFRQNAAFGTCKVEDGTLTQAWSVPVGSLRVEKDTLYGVGWTGQPAIIKWYKEARELMNLYPEKQSKEKLIEVIIGALDGKIYFLDLEDGSATRDPIDQGSPIAGSVSVNTGTAPMLAVGQNASRLYKKTVDTGYRVYSLLNGSRLLFLDGKQKGAVTANGTFDGSALFDKDTGNMIVAGENGMLYTVDFGEITGDHLIFDHIAGTITVKPTVQRYTAIVKNEKKADTGVESSVAMYANYAYYADSAGILQCVDVSTLTPMWAADMGDNTDATIALDCPDASTVALYTGTTIDNQGKKGVSTIRRLNALTGEQVWAYTVEGVAYDSKHEAGCVGSPIVGQNSLSDVVIFNVSNGDAGGVLLALSKKDGSIVWRVDFPAYSHSSPVAIYNADGDAWIALGDSSGMLYLLDGKDGSTVASLQLEGQIIGSPAVYRNMLVVGTSGKDVSQIYGIEIK